MPQGWRRSLAPLALIFLIGGCASRSVETFSSPVDPANAVEGFLTAVQARDLTTMGNLWGTARGLARRTMSDVEYEMRLSVMQRYLSHDSYEIVATGPGVVAAPGQRAVNVQLRRNGCEVVVPFLLEQGRAGWLISEIDLTQAGNPARRC